MAAMKMLFCLYFNLFEICVVFYKMVVYKINGRCEGLKLVARIFFYRYVILYQYRYIQ